MQVDDATATISAALEMPSCGGGLSGYLASGLELQVQFFQQGIIRAVVDQHDSTRFRISDEDLPVEWDQLNPVANLTSLVSQDSDELKVDGLSRDDGSDKFEYHINLDPFYITQMINGKITMQTSSSLYFEDGASFSTNDDSCFSALQSRAQSRSGVDIFDDTDFSAKQAISWGFNIATNETHFYGIPEREDTLALKATNGTDPYEIFATDHLHKANEGPGPLYGSIPYVMGLTSKAATGFLWVNSAKTTVDLDENEMGWNVTFASEANALELFMFGSQNTKNQAGNRVKNVQNDLATISGFAPLPLLHMLGYHFCKWAPVSADMLMERNANFTRYGFPIDVIWSDIEWA